MAPSNEPPEIPNLKPQGGKEEEKKGAGSPLSRLGRGGPSSPAGESGAIREPENPLTNLGGTRAESSSAEKPATGSGFRFPGFGGKGSSMPNLRVRGLSGGSTLVDRLKNLRKKDLIFILAGLCTLGTAPLAEHLLMAPEEPGGQLKEGFDSKGPLFQDGTSVYEPGNGVGSPGGLVGQGSDVITPLNVRDPSNLVMSPGAKKQADAVVTPPPPPSASAGKAEPDWKDVLRDTAKAGATKGIQAAAKLPMPNVKLAGAIRGLSALGGGGGGTGASLKLEPLSAQHAPNHAAESNSLSRSQAAPGFRGAATRSNASSGSDEALRAAGMKQADIFNKGGSAANALDTASREQIPNGGGPGQFGGRPGDGDASKNPGGNSNKDNKQMGESLAYLRAKMEMEKAIDLKWKEKEWNQFGRSKMIQESAIKMGFDMFGKFAQAAFVDPLANFIGQAIQPQSAALYNCVLNQGGARVGGTKAAIQAQGYTVIGTTLWSSSGDNKQPVGTCTVQSGGSAGPTQDPNADPNAPSRIQGPPRTNVAGETASRAQAAYDRYCGASAAEKLSQASCDAIAKIKIEVDNSLPRIEKNNNDALTFIGQGYQQMTAEQASLDKAVTSLGSVTGNKDGAVGNGKSPLSVLVEKFQSAQQNLSAFKNAQAKTDLTNAKSQGDQPIVGQGGTIDALTAGAALADAKGQQPTTTDASQQAKANLDNGTKQVKAGQDLAAATLKKINGIAQLPGTDSGGAVLESLRSEVQSKIASLQDLLTKTGGTNGDNGGYNKTALDLYSSQVEKLHADVYGNSVDASIAQPRSSGGQFAQSGAMGAVSDATRKEEGALSVLTGWKDATSPEVVQAAAAANGAKSAEQIAAEMNSATLNGQLGQFIQTSAPAARTAVVPLGPESQQVKTKLASCSKTFVCQ